MNNKITIIEGPTPNFELVERQSEQGGPHTWAAGILEGPYLFNTAFTSVRTFNSETLLDRCLAAWEQRKTMYLEYKDRIGLTQQAPIIAARSVSTEEGDMLYLWVRRELDDEDPPEMEEDDLNY